MTDFSNFNWGKLSQKEIDWIKNDSINCYNKHFEVEEGDIVVDFGAFVGSFTYNILEKKPEHCWVLEPVEEHFKTLYSNLKNKQVSFTKAAITNEKEIEIEWCKFKSVAKGITFKEFIDMNGLEKIDFFKCDCEGGEYDIFLEHNIDYLKNIKKIAVEFHLRGEQKEKFRYFRDNILKHFNKYYIYSIDDVDIKWDLFNEHFIEYYKEITIHFDNR